MPAAHMGGIYSVFIVQSPVIIRRTDLVIFEIFFELALRIGQIQHVPDSVFLCKLIGIYGSAAAICRMLTSI